MRRAMAASAASIDPAAVHVMPVADAARIAAANDTVLRAVSAVPAIITPAARARIATTAAASGRIAVASAANEANA